MFSGTVILLILLIVGVFWWQSQMRAAEKALEVCKAFCDANNVQLLDQTIALHKLRFKRDSGTLKCFRQYRFEYTLTGDVRYKGEVHLVGAEVVHQHLFSPEITIEAEPQPLADKNNVLEFTKRAPKNDA
jgi:hypothetical protein